MNIKREPNKVTEHLTKADIVKLSGVLGIHPDAMTNRNVFIEYAFHVNLMQLYICSDEILALSVFIDLEENVIENHLFCSYNRTPGLSLKWIKSQVEHAKKFKAHRLKGDAVKQDDTYFNNFRIVWSGYYIWGKYGYFMSDPNEKIRFVNLMNDNYRKEKSLFKLSLDREAYQIWIDNGWTWKCVFNLKRNSYSNINLKKKIKLKRLLEI